MCKLLIMSGITDATRDNAWKFAIAMSEPMSNGNSDGLGYAAMDKEGNLFGERWWRNAEAFKDQYRVPLEAHHANVVDEYQGFLDKEEKYNSFGDVGNSNQMTSLCLHTRMATSGKVFINTHPFVHNDTALVHNGVISNSDKIGYINSSCDSESILKKYLKHDVAKNPKEIKQLVQGLSGWYAVGVLAYDKKGNPILDVFKESMARLVAVEIKELNTIVFTTLLEHAVSSCAKLGFTILNTYDVNDDMLIRFNAVTGKVITSVKFKSRGQVSYTSKSYDNWPSKYSDSNPRGYGSSSYEEWSGASNTQQSKIKSISDNSHVTKSRLDGIVMSDMRSILKEKARDRLAKEFNQEFSIDDETGEIIQRVAGSLKDK